MCARVQLRRIQGRIHYVVTHGASVQRIGEHVNYHVVGVQRDVNVSISSRCVAVRDPNGFTLL